MPTRTHLSLLSLGFLSILLISSCVPLKMLPAEKPKGNPFFRIYPVSFKDFHPQLNQAIQKHAKEKPGNSFQMARLGSDMVVIRGAYKQGTNQERLPVVITAKPVGPQKTSLEIKPSANQSGISEAAAGELFQIIERETGFLPI